MSYINNIYNNLNMLDFGEILDSSFFHNIDSCLKHNQKNKINLIFFWHNLIFKKSK